MNRTSARSEGFGEFLARKRADRDLSQKKLAELADISSRTVYRAEVNGDIPRAKTVAKIGQILGGDVKEWLSVAGYEGLVAGIADGSISVDEITGTSRLARNAAGHAPLRALFERLSAELSDGHDRLMFVVCPGELRMPPTALEGLFECLRKGLHLAVCVPYSQGVPGVRSPLGTIQQGVRLQIQSVLVATARPSEGVELAGRVRMFEPRTAESDAIFPPTPFQTFLIMRDPLAAGLGPDFSSRRAFRDSSTFGEIWPSRDVHGGDHTTYRVNYDRSLGIDGVEVEALEAFFSCYADLLRTWRGHDQWDMGPIRDSSWQAKSPVDM